MTMHLVHPGLSTLNTSKTKRKPGAKQVRAMEEHNQWLRKQGLHPEQLAAKGREKPRKLSLNLRVDRDGPQCTNGFAPGGAKKSVFDTQWTDRYKDDPLLAEREQEALRRAEDLKSRLMPLYNKGPVQLQTNLAGLKDGNGRGRN